MNNKNYHSLLGSIKQVMTEEKIPSFSGSGTDAAQSKNGAFDALSGFGPNDIQSPATKGMFVDKYQARLSSAIKRATANDLLRGRPRSGQSGLIDMMVTDGKSVEEIADILGIELDDVKSQLNINEEAGQAAPTGQTVTVYNGQLGFVDLPANDIRLYYDRLEARNAVERNNELIAYLESNFMPDSPQIAQLRQANFELGKIVSGEERSARTDGIEQVPDDLQPDLGDGGGADFSVESRQFRLDPRGNDDMFEETPGTTGERELKKRRGSKPKSSPDSDDGPEISGPPDSDDDKKDDDEKKKKKDKPKGKPKGRPRPGAGGLGPRPTFGKASGGPFNPMGSG